MPSRIWELLVVLLELVFIIMLGCCWLLIFRVKEKATPVKESPWCDAMIFLRSRRSRSIDQEKNLTLPDLCYCDTFLSV